VTIKTIIDDVRAAIAAINDVAAYFRKRKATRVASYCGKWTNEGDCTGSQPSHYVELDLSPTKRGVSGLVSSRGSESNLPMASFHGEIKWGKLHGTITGVSRGNLVVYGKVNMAVKHENLRFVATEVLASFLPSTTVLWRHE